ncbi:hypothetical protein MP228_003276 [Amoeboaphelidium protococcarum]|nr:hypothetical protein MP228_003276 [Amoeboaphelidium protococcarum]
MFTILAILLVILSTLTSLKSDFITKDYSGNCCDDISKCRNSEGKCGTGPEYCGCDCVCGACLTCRPSIFPKVSYPRSDIEEFDGFRHFNFTVDYCPHNVWMKNGVITLRMDSVCGTRLSSKKKFKEGYFEARIKTATTSGVVTSFILMSSRDPHEKADEIDFEWVGKIRRNVQTNFFVDSVLNYTNVKGFTSPYDTSEVFQTYAIDFNKKRIKYYINGNVVRTVKNDGVNPYPKRPMHVQIGIWDGTQTSGWAGTVDHTKGPFYVYVDYVRFRYTR